ncbi:hypothetical protein OG369_04510 [Streptomyces sp. NBC_01221]|uniref:hypothetical protein n=1 Tax=Streptomyces sp. NBC_01221 TaxID=2903782 RepID=UPI0022504179|nr:hypothetical protein [Streptomyces sp. NBC_01221]MCX4785462.1 hypothetical protein [Streptomyces sp. NBC_01221]
MELELGDILQDLGEERQRFAVADTDALPGEHQVRRFTLWSRWAALATLAHAFLVVVRANEHTRRSAPVGLIPLTWNEIQRLLTTPVVLAHV